MGDNCEDIVDDNVGVTGVRVLDIIAAAASPISLLRLGSGAPTVSRCLNCAATRAACTAICSQVSELHGTDMQANPARITETF
jgi:hypothetical protein